MAEVKPAKPTKKTPEQLRAELDASKKAWRDYVSYYRSYYGLKSDPPAALKKRFDSTYIKGGWRTDYADEWIRKNDKNYKFSTPYKKVVGQLSDLYHIAFGPDYKVTTADIAKMDAQARRPSVSALVDSQRAETYFRNHILNTPEFKQRNPAFSEWLAQNRGLTSIVDGLEKYQTAYSSFLSTWQDAGMTGPVPESIMVQAMTNNWDAQGNAFATAIHGSAEFKGTQSYADRQTDFAKQWAAVMPAGTAVDPALAEAYAKSPKSWDDFLRDTVSTSHLFTNAYPDYAAWEERQHKIGGEGNVEGQVTIQDYFEARSTYADLWASEYEDGQPVDPAVISEAMANNWSPTVFKNKIRQLPQFQNTPAAKNKKASFATYWRGLFGDGAPVDEALADQYTRGDITDPSAMWEDIKGTSMFQSQFANWNTFANAQAEAGNNVTEDPMAYKEYQTAFAKAFADIGMQVPNGMDKQIFASGMKSNEITQNADTYGTTKDSYDWQTGQQADVGTAIGVGNKVAGGDLRKRMEAALAQHKTYARSTFNQFDTGSKNDMMIKKI